MPVSSEMSAAKSQFSFSCLVREDLGNFYRQKASR
jgi:hypothetical protein